MKKIFLAHVLSIVSVFSVSAQTDNKASVNPVVIENIKAAVKNPATEGAQVKTNEKPGTETAETNPAPIVEEKKPQITEEKKSAQTAEQTETETLESVKKPEMTETSKTPETADASKPNLTVKVTETPAPVNKTEAETPKPATTPDEPVEATQEQVLEAQKPSLGGLSTGNTAVDSYIEEFSTLYNIDPLLIYAQMSQESSFKARATSSKGASGFMQLMPATAARFGVTNIYNPKQNIKAGVKYMRWLLDKFGGDKRLALAGYNAGEGAVMKYGNKVPPYRETQNYVTKIMNHYELLSNQNSTLAQSEETLNK